MSRPCKLQIKTSGAWRNVLDFDLETADVEALQSAATTLVLIADRSDRTGLRIATADGLQTALVRWTAVGGWVDA